MSKTQKETIEPVILPEPIIKIVDTEETWIDMILRIQDETEFALDTETVGKGSLPFFEQMPGVKARWFEAARAHCTRFPRAKGGKDIKGYKTSLYAVNRIAKELQALEKKAQKDLSGLHFWENYLGCVQIGLEDGTVYMIRPQKFTEEHWKLLGIILNSADVLLLANAVFDIKMMYQHTKILLDGRKIFDVQIAQYLIKNGSSKFIQKSVKALCKEYLGIELSKDAAVRISNWLAAWSPSQLKYAAFDVIVLFPIWRKLKKLIFQWSLNTEARLRMDFTTVCAIMDMSGIPIEIGEKPLYRVTDEENNKFEISGTFLELKKQYQDVIKAKEGTGYLGFRDRMEHRLWFQEYDLNVQWQTDPDFNWNSPIQVYELLSQQGYIVPDTNEDTLKRLYGNDPGIVAIIEYRGTVKLLQSINKYIDYSRDGRIYSQFKLMHTETGRLASGSEAKNPDPWYINGQNPTKGEFRSYIKPPKGRKFINADYSQIELRWMAHFSQDAALLETFRSGGDPHKDTAARTLALKGIDYTSLAKPKQKDYRQKAKATNFGLIFGANAETLMNYAKAEYGVDMTLEEAEEERNAWFGVYPGVRKWQWNYPKTIFGTKYKDKETGEEKYIPGTNLSRTASNFLRHFPLENYTQALNTPIQGSAHAGMMNFLNLLFYNLIEDGFIPLEDFFIPAEVHDEVIIEVVERYVKDIYNRVEEFMIAGMSHFLKTVPVEIEINIVESWAEK